MIIILGDVKTQGFVFAWRLRAIRGAYLASLVLYYSSFVQLLENLNDKRRSEEATNSDG